LLQIASHRIVLIPILILIRIIRIKSNRIAGHRVRPPAIWLELQSDVWI
jgi:hypothetical protein